MDDINSLDKFDKIIKSTQNKLIASVNSYRHEKKLFDNKFTNVEGKIDIISEQFDEILANNISLNTKIEYLEAKVS